MEAPFSSRGFQIKEIYEVIESSIPYLDVCYPAQKIDCGVEDKLEFDYFSIWPIRRATEVSLITGIYQLILLQYLEKMQLEYHDMAADKGLYVVGACGMDCIPTDLGTVFLKKQFQGKCSEMIRKLSNLYK